jgi:hypothetical protein
MLAPCSRLVISKMVGSLTSCFAARAKNDVTSLASCAASDWERCCANRPHSRRFVVTVFCRDSYSRQKKRKFYADINAKKEKLYGMVNPTRLHACRLRCLPN